MDAFDEAAELMVEALKQLEPDAQAAYRYLFARVASDAGLLALIGTEQRRSGARLIYQEPTSGAFYHVDRPPDWTDAEEDAYVREMRRSLLGDD